LWSSVRREEERGKVLPCVFPPNFSNQFLTREKREGKGKKKEGVREKRKKRGEENFGLAVPGLLLACGREKKKKEEGDMQDRAELSE